MDKRKIRLMLKRDFTWGELMQELHGEGLENARKIDAEGKGDEFMELLCELQEDERELNGDGLELEQVNTYLWLGFERIQERLNMEVENG